MQRQQNTYRSTQFFVWINHLFYRTDVIFMANHLTTVLT